MSRTKKTVVNTTTSLICAAISSVLSFVLQAVFIRLLGLEYSGINNLFSDILSILNIAELGTVNAILFRLYKYIAQDDQEGITLFLSTYRKICIIVAAFVGIVGSFCIPFLGKLIKEQPSFPESLWSLYVIVLATSVIGHYWDYKGIIIIAKQDRYIHTIISYTTIFLKHGLQIAFLAIFRNIYLYLGVAFVTTALKGILNGVYSKKKYHVVWKTNKTISKEEKRSLFKDIKNLAVYKVCRTLDATVDTFLISKYVDIATVGIYGSFSMLLSALNEFLCSFNDGMIASIGDLYARNDKEQVESVFFQSMHLTFLIYGISSVVLTSLLSAFVQWWIGFTLPQESVFLLVLNFYMYGFGMNVSTFRNSMGIFKKGWLRPAFTAFFNLVFSFVLVRRIGLIGTLAGTTIARVLTLVWYDPYLVCKHGIGISPAKYYYRYVVYLTATIAFSAVVFFLSSGLPPIDTLISAIWHGGLYLACSVILVGTVGAFFPEQRGILNRASSLINSIREHN